MDGLNEVANSSQNFPWGDVVGGVLITSGRNLIKQKNPVGPNKQAVDMEEEEAQWMIQARALCLLALSLQAWSCPVPHESVCNYDWEQLGASILPAPLLQRKNILLSVPAQTSQGSL